MSAAPPAAPEDCSFLSLAFPTPIPFPENSYNCGRGRGGAGRGGPGRRQQGPASAGTPARTPARERGGRPGTLALRGSRPGAPARPRRCVAPVRQPRPGRRSLPRTDAIFLMDIYFFTWVSPTPRADRPDPRPGPAPALPHAPPGHARLARREVVFTPRLPAAGREPRGPVRVGSGGRGPGGGPGHAPGCMRPLPWFVTHFTTGTFCTTTLQ